jgi:hypothetical protein
MTRQRPAALSLGILFLVAWCGVLASPAVSRSAEARPQPAGLAFEDQFRNRREIGAMRGDVVVLVYANRTAAEAAVGLGRRLHLRFHPTAASAAAEEWSRQPVTPLAGWPAGVRVPDVHVIPVACLPEVPKPLHAVARSRLRKESEFVSVWLDFEDAMRATFGMVADEPNIAVIDTQGRTHSVRSGHLDDLGVAELAGLIERLRWQARADQRTAIAPVSTPR